MPSNQLTKVSEFVTVAYTLFLFQNEVQAGLVFFFLVNHNSAETVLGRYALAQLFLVS